MPLQLKDVKAASGLVLAGWRRKSSHFAYEIGTKKKLESTFCVYFPPLLLPGNNPQCSGGEFDTREKKIRPARILNKSHFLVLLQKRPGKKVSSYSFSDVVFLFDYGKKCAVSVCARSREKTRRNFCFCHSPFVRSSVFWPFP